MSREVSNRSTSAKAARLQPQSGARVAARAFSFTCAARKKNKNGFATTHNTGDKSSASSTGREQTQF